MRGPPSELRLVPGQQGPTPLPAGNWKESTCVNSYPAQERKGKSHRKRLCPWATAGTPRLELLEEKWLDLGATSWAALAITPQTESREGTTGPDPAVLSWACTFQQAALCLGGSIHTFSVHPAVSRKAQRGPLGAGTVARWASVLKGRGQPDKPHILCQEKILQIYCKGKIHN